MWLQKKDINEIIYVTYEWTPTYVYFMCLPFTKRIKQNKKRQTNNSNNLIPQGENFVKPSSSAV